jgi:SHS2 domain-containing protein
MEVALATKFWEIDHSGDVGIDACGADLAELIENATRGLFALQYRGSVAEVTTRSVGVVSESLEDLLVDWLSEVIALGGANGELYGSVEVTAVTGEGSSTVEAAGVVRGEPFDDKRHQPRFDVKAATYHGLDVRRVADGLRARIILDL